MYIDKQEHYTDIYPFVDTKAEMPFSFRIAVYPDKSSITFDHRVLTIKAARQLMAALQEALRIAEEAADVY